MLHAEGIGRRFGTRWLFRHLDLDLGAGDVLVVTGPNGSGKSTLLRILAGLDGPSEGHLTRPKTVGYAGLDLALYPQLTPREHLEWAAEHRNRPARQADAYGLPPGERAEGLSSGQRSRLRLALAESHEPDLLLLDEPGVALDE
ncbi:MAG: ABC transporter ATP-binding protein, partial [Armatimonadota bacterium]